MPRPAWFVALVALVTGGALVAGGLATAEAEVRARAKRRSAAITIDGRLDDPAWADAPRQKGFTQRFPKDGVPASLSTEFAILYDDDAIYVGVWAADPEPSLIRRLLTRRDVDALADAIAIGIDSYQDRRTAYLFQLNAAGVQRDALLFDDELQDDTWDAVWTGDTAITLEGWTAEFRIPLSQLRFAARDRHAWGLQVIRTVARTQEQASWSPWPRSTPQVVSKFGVIDGIENIRTRARLELLPYASAGARVAQVDGDDPLDDGRDLLRGAGLDLEYGLGPAFTLSATLNPDFGQVEADPSQVNLTANELFFAERRPFFLEGVDLFKLPIGNSDDTVEGAFYSRRIGAAPLEPDVDYAYLRAPTATTIYGAAKLTGKTSSGWSVGVLDAVTAEETATIVDAEGRTASPVVAPLTNHAVARLKRDLNGGRTMIGLSATSVHRALGDTPLAARLHDQAYTGGLQLQHRFGGNAWLARVHAVGSWVHGSPEAIAETQQAARHLYQRPGMSHAHFDPTRTSLSGLGATWQVGRLGDTKHVRFGTGGDLRTIGLELNDLGFQTFSDRVIPYVWAQYREDQPGEHVLNWQVSGDFYAVSTLEPELTERGFECNGSVQLAGYWTLSAGCTLADRVADPPALRGGPTLRLDPRLWLWLGLTTDTRKPVWLTLNASGGRAWTPDELDAGVDVGATIQARSNIDLFIGPSIYSRSDPMQYVDEVTDTAGATHYVFARIRQRVTSLTLRVNWTFSPRLTLQAYAQPFLASGRYSELKDVDDPGARRYEDRFTPIHGTSYTLDDGVYTVRTPTASYSFDEPDFSFRQLRSTVVLRWEYRPGSTVFAIWSHGRTSELADGRYQLGRDVRALADAGGEHVVMLKANYWIGL